MFTWGGKECLHGAVRNVYMVAVKNVYMGR